MIEKNDDTSLETVRLRISEIFYSLQGEAKFVGIPTVFIRLTGCPLRCQYCDSEYAFTGGKVHSLDEVLAQVDTYPTRYITVTGGEPLAQKSCLQLLSTLCDRGYTVSLETSGALDVANVDPRVIKVMDIKTPDSQESARNLYQNMDYLTRHDQVKFVICSRQDYEWAKETIAHYQLYDRCELLFSPSYHQLEPTLLADWILADGLPVRFQIQLHKYLWGDVPGK